MVNDRDSKVDLKKIYYISQMTLDWFEMVPLQLYRYEQGNQIMYHGMCSSELQILNMGDRFLLIIAIANAIHYLDFLKEQLNLLGNDTYSGRVPRIIDDKEKKEIRILRNANVHLDDYVINKGRNQSDFISSFTSATGISCQSDASSTIIIDGEIMFGGVNISKICNKIIKQLPTIREIVGEIQNEYVNTVMP